MSGDPAHNPPFPRAIHAVDLGYELTPFPPAIPAPGRNRAERRRYAKLARMVAKGSAGPGQIKALEGLKAQLARAAAFAASVAKVRAQLETVYPRANWPAQFRDRWDTQLRTMAQNQVMTWEHESSRM